MMMSRTVSSFLLFVACCVACACGSASETPTANAPANQNTQPAAAKTVAPAPLSVFQVEWGDSKIPSEMQPDKDYTVSVTLKNTGNQHWPAKGVGANAANQVSVSYHWLPETGVVPVVAEGVRSPFPHDIAPGETVTLSDVHVVAPKAPGSYRLQVTLVQEMVSWFEGQGARTIMVPVKVR